MASIQRLFFSPELQFGSAGTGREKPGESVEASTGYRA